MMASQIPWERMVQVLMQCGSVHDAHSFSVNAIEQIRTLIPFDQGRVYFFNDNAEIYDEFLLGVDKRVTRVYHEYYANVEDGLYNAAKRAWNFHGKYPPVHDWSSLDSSDEFFAEHLRPQGIRFSTGLLLHDLRSTPKVMFCLDRTGSTTYSSDEIEALYYLSTSLDNLYRNFYAQPPGVRSEIASKLQDDLPLTPRESEVAELLIKGVSPEHIALDLRISIHTAYKHIANLHGKLHVSNRQELLLKLLELTQ